MGLGLVGCWGELRTRFSHGGFLDFDSLRFLVLRSSRRLSNEFLLGEFEILVWSLYHFALLLRLAVCTLIPKRSDRSLFSRGLFDRLETPLLFLLQNVRVSNSLVLFVVKLFIRSWILNNGGGFSRRFFSRSSIVSPGSVVVNQRALLGILVVFSNECLVLIGFVNECVFDEDWVGRPELCVDLHLGQNSLDVPYDVVRNRPNRNASVLTCRHKQFAVWTEAKRGNIK